MLDYLKALHSIGSCSLEQCHSVHRLQCAKGKLAGPPSIFTGFARLPELPRRSTRSSTRVIAKSGQGAWRR